MKIPDSVVPDIYLICQRVFNNELTAAQGNRHLVETYGLNQSSVDTFIRNFEHMLNGRRFRRTLNLFAMRYFLERFTIDYDSQTLFKALSALMQHISYIEDQTGGKHPGMRQVFSEFVTRLPQDFQDEFEQDDIEEDVKSTPREKLIAYLKNLKKTDDDHVMIDGKSYKRDNHTLAVIKQLRDFACQVCNTKILKRDGTFYIEAAHIKARSQFGRETPDNILLLCPNHHKEFDYGETEITFHDADKVVFMMNGKSYSVTLTIE
ncbi:HNH endonuclease [Hymenobacter monticola]|uniref:HNH endonuclease n=1 Tax=Hymenobacter monticola TaxID=1705399 RepID=A0ABY4B124_9BACT|nr:HNH endonuclease [Hymenobacter monticola]UOE32824.1 HNH endonuclease [Hymenobacter monticola]